MSENPNNNNKPEIDINILNKELEDLKQKMELMFNMMQKVNRNEIIASKKLNIYDDEIAILKEDNYFMKNVVTNHTTALEELKKVANSAAEAITNIEKQSSEINKKNEQKKDDSVINGPG